MSPRIALDSALRYVKEHPGSDFAVGRGDSMLPLYHDRAVIILERPAISELKVGQTVVFMGANGVPVAHVLVRHAADGWVTMGLNNTEVRPGIPFRRSGYAGGGGEGLSADLQRDPGLQQLDEGHVRGDPLADPRLNWSGNRQSFRASL